MKHILILGFFIIAGCSDKPENNAAKLEFKKTSVNPVLSPDSSFVFYCPMKEETVNWQKADLFNPAAVIRDDKIFVLYRAEDNPAAILGGRTSRIGLAFSTDGINFTKHPEPVLYPEQDDFSIYDNPGGCEDPRVVQVNDSMYIMAYTSWDYKIARLSIAISKDLYSWEKKGPAFRAAYKGRFADHWSKSGSIITRLIGNKLVAAKIKGKYWMYWGEEFVNLAWSENLYDWYPVLDSNNELKRLISPRNGKFDSRLTECGPPAIVTSEGIVLYYNGKNSEEANADPALPRGTYSVGRVIFSNDDLEKVVSRTDSCLLKPDLPHEVTGQYKSGTVFSEGLVFFKNQWFLYYGTADSFVGLAIAPAN
ncbi:MAG TPA: glycoside hydrolase family 130 protein [Bacteroidales bacterium]|nr:glycoside hydrolase family 130 protein [Bacteroidales bacterium]